MAGSFRRMAVGHALREVHTDGVWLVGNQACLGHGGNRIWMRITCDETVYGPPLNTHCTTLDGPATCAPPPGEAERLA